MLDAEVHARAGAFEIDIELAAAPHETVAVLGPNGAGKTTLLAVLAGLVPLSRGRVALFDEVLDEPTARTWVPPERRPVALVFQHYLLFPHLTALDNVAFGLRARGKKRNEARHQAAVWLGRMGLGDRAGARPHQLSGGQAQRVALARALAVEPALLLLDEPLAALDVGTRSELRRDLRSHLATFPGVRVLVTHDPLEAMVLADHLIVLEGGKVVQTGTAADLAARPRSSYVAELVGTNLFHGTARDSRIALTGGAQLVAATSIVGEVLALVHPHAIALHREAPRGSARNVWPGKARSIEPAADRLRIRVDGPLAVVAEVTRAAQAELGISEGDEVWVSIKATEVEVYPV
jgi:molybdate transport system ATP-binding protein